MMLIVIRWNSLERSEVEVAGVTLTIVGDAPDELDSGEILVVEVVIE